MAKYLKMIWTKNHFIDNLYGSGVTWNGQGDVQLVENETAADRLLALDPKMFEEVTAETKALEAMQAPFSMKGIDAVSPSVLDGVIVTEADGTELPALEASRDALARYASEELGLMVKDGHTKAYLLTAIGTAHTAIEKFKERARPAAPAAAEKPPAEKAPAPPVPPANIPAGESNKDTEAYRARETGMPWKDVAEKVGFENARNAMAGAKDFAQANDLPWPVPLPEAAPPAAESEAAAPPAPAAAEKAPAAADGPSELVPIEQEMRQAGADAPGASDRILH